MRLYFPNKESEDVLIAPGDTAIGAASDNVIVLQRPGVAAHHVSLGVHERSLVLSVLDAQARTHVNARPVREKAILRLVDIVSLDQVPPASVALGDTSHYQITRGILESPERYWKHLARGTSDDGESE